MDNELPPSGAAKIRGPLSEGCCHWTPIAFPATDSKPSAGPSNASGERAPGCGEVDAALPGDPLRKPQSPA